MKRSEAIDHLANLIYQIDASDITTWELAELILEELEEWEVVTQKWDKEDESIN